MDDTSVVGNLEARLGSAVKIAGKAGLTALSYFRKAEQGTLRISTKGIQDWLSEADQAVERQIRADLAKTFPHDGFLGEETGGALHEQCTWVIDPIDGTANFIRGIDRWCISIACYHRAAGVITGVVFDPIRDRMFSACPGGGACCNGSRIRVSGQDSLDASLIILGYSRRKPIYEHVATMTALLNAQADCRLFGSAALGLAEVAAGKAECFHEAHNNSWDALAGLLLVAEAGGVCTPYANADFVEKGGRVTATNRQLSHRLKAILG